MQNNFDVSEALEQETQCGGRPSAAERIAQLEEQLRDSEDVVRQLQEHLDKQQQLLNGMNNNVEETQPKLLYNEFTQEEARRFRDQAMTLATLYEQLREDYDIRQKEFNIRQKKFEDREIELCDILITQQLLDDANRKMEDMAKELTSKEDEICAMKDAYKELNAMYEETDLQSRVWQHEVTGLKEVAREGRTATEELQLLRSKVESLEANARDKEMEVDSLEKTLRELQTKHDDCLEQKENQLISKNQEFCALWDAYKKLIADYEASVSFCCELQDQLIQVCAREGRTATEELQLLRSQVESLEANARNKEMEVDSLQKTLRELQRKHDDCLKQKFVTERGNYGDIDPLTHKLSRLMLLVDVKDKKIRVLEKQCREEQRKNSDVENKIRDMTARLQQMEEEVRRGEKGLSVEGSMIVTHTETFGKDGSLGSYERDEKGMMTSLPPEPHRVVDLPSRSNFVRQASGATPSSHSLTPMKEKKDEISIPQVVRKEKVETPFQPSILQSVKEHGINARYGSTTGTDCDPSARAPFRQSPDFQSLPIHLPEPWRLQSAVPSYSLSHMNGRASATSLLGQNLRSGHTSNRSAPYHTKPPKEEEM